MDGALLSAFLVYGHLEEYAGDTGVESLVGLCYGAATEYLAGAGIARTDKNPGRYDLSAFALALSCYERRDVTITGTIVAENPVLSRMITQLQIDAESPVSKLDTAPRGYSRAGTPTDLTSSAEVNSACGEVCCANARDAAGAAGKEAL